MPALHALVLLFPVPDPDSIKLENLHVRRRSGQDVMLLDVRIVGKEEGPIAENVVKVVDAGYVVR